MASLAKNFEKKFHEDWCRTMPNSFIMRIPDQMSKYKDTSQNICDYICFKDGILYLIELKTTKGNTLSFKNISQYDKLIRYIGVNKVRTGVIVWFYEKDKIIYVPASSMKQMRENGEKSINLKKTLDKGIYKCYNIDGVKRRVYFDSDYSILTTTEEEE